MMISDKSITFSVTFGDREAVFVLGRGREYGLAQVEDEEGRPLLPHGEEGSMVFDFGGQPLKVSGTPWECWEKRNKIIHRFFREPVHPCEGCGSLVKVRAVGVFHGPVPHGVEEGLAECPTCAGYSYKRGGHRLVYRSPSRALRVFSLGKAAEGLVENVDEVYVQEA